MSLCRVPADIIRLIAVNLDPDDLFHLAISSGYFRHLLYDNVTCRKILESIRFSLEYTQETATRDCARVLRKLIKRREALRMARPFHVLEVSSEALQFTYTNGAVCYTTVKTSPTYQHLLRVLVLEGSSVEEVIIDVPSLLKASDIPSFTEWKPYQFKPLYHADGIVSCLYEQKRPPITVRRLIIYSLKKKEILDSHSLSSAANIFVRNNSKYLYYGTKSYFGNGNRRWMLQGFSLEHSTWLARRILCDDLAGSDVGLTVCFEIFGGHLYGVSSQESTGMEDCEWGSLGRALDSFYYAFRLPLNDPSQIQTLPRSALWRRGAIDGPIDDRWSQIQLGQDEKSGRVSIFETRKEWLSSWSRRTCYQKQLSWPSVTQSTDGDPEDNCSERLDEVVNREIAPEDSVHRGDAGFSSSTFDFNNSPVRSYDPSCQTFVDIVSTTTASSPTTKRLRLRVRRRPQELCPTSESGHMPSSPTGLADVTSDSEDHYVRLWPANEGEQKDKQPNEALDNYIDELLNPTARFDEVDWAMDGKVLVYSPKSLNDLNEPRSIILVSFDPALHFQGLCHWDGFSTPPDSMGRQLNKGGNAPPCGSSLAVHTAADFSKARGLDLSVTAKNWQRTRASSSTSTNLTGFSSRKKPRLKGDFRPKDTTPLHYR